MSDRKALLSKLVDEKCRIQFSIALVDLADRDFQWFSLELT